MEEQIKMSGLEILSSSSSSSSSSFSSLSQLQWNPTNQWSPLLGGAREEQACVTIVSGNGAQSYENDAAAQTIVVLGGRMLGCTSNSVIVWDPSTMEWRYVVPFC